MYEPRTATCLSMVVALRPSDHIGVAGWRVEFPNHQNLMRQSTWHTKDDSSHEHVGAFNDPGYQQYHIGICNPNEKNINPYHSHDPPSTGP